MFLKVPKTMKLSCCTAHHSSVLICRNYEVLGSVQWALSRQLSMCDATIPGSHNSAIDLADGYGNLDSQFQQYFAWIKWVVSSSFNMCRGHALSVAFVWIQRPPSFILCRDDWLTFLRCPDSSRTCAHVLAWACRHQ